MTKRQREEILFAVVSAEVSKGHLKWRASDLARRAGVSRPLLYYHFGRSKDEILATCLDLIAEDYFGFSSPARTSAEMLASLRKTRATSLAHPFLAVFYQRVRSGDSPLSAQLREIEERYQLSLRNRFPGLSKRRSRLAHALFHGLVTAPFLDDDDFTEGVRTISRLFKSE